MFAGGLSAVIFTDTLQTVIMLTGSAILAGMGMNEYFIFIKLVSKRPKITF